MRWLAWVLSLTILTGGACNRAPEARQYEVRGQILSVDANRREVLDEGHFDEVQGLMGDTWPQRRWRLTPDGSPHPDTQLTLMGVRAIGAITEEARWPLAGDQLYLDLDISEANLPAGTRLALGSAVIEVTDQPHTGCQKFSSRFGVDALRFVNSPVGRELHLRGINARVVEGGTVRAGDTVRKLPA